MNLKGREGGRRGRRNQFALDLDLFWRKGIFNGSLLFILSGIFLKGLGFYVFFGLKIKGKTNIKILVKKIYFPFF